ncbi:MAG: helix-turn-helix domain-containing protein [Ruminococcaceae bacterium]|nr:helix-turn-helix domain-containing protein [Oscillospiraceae bacterium]
MMLCSPNWRYLRTPAHAADYSFFDPNHPAPTWFYGSSKEAGIIMDNHLHKEMEIHCMMHGQMQVTVGGHEFTLSPGDILIVNPYELHEGRIAPGKPARYVHTVFDLRHFTSSCGSEVEALRNKICSGKLRFPNHLTADTDGARQIVSELMRLFEAYELAKSLPSAGDSCLTGAICTLIGRLFLHAPPTENLTNTKRSVEFIHTVLGFVEEHFAEDLTTERTASELRYNKCYFCTLFKQNFGMTFTDYLNEYRIEQAIQYLHQDPLSMTEIAARVGFSNYGYFSRSFKKRMGISPSEYFKK